MDADREGKALRGGAAMWTHGTILDHISVEWRGNSLLISVTEDGRTARILLWPEEVEEFMEAMA